MTAKQNRQTGFTLIEVIVTIIVSAILAVLLIQVMHGHSTRSYWPLQKIDEGLELRRVIENISSDYRNLMITSPTPLMTLQQNINDGNYWTAIPIVVRTNKCLDDIHRDDMAQPGEIRVSGSDTCNQTDALLKVTLAYDNQSLTAVFSR